MRCDECNGEGILAYDRRGIDELMCSKCDGTGEVEEEDCITQFKRYREGVDDGSI